MTPTERVVFTLRGEGPMTLPALAQRLGYRIGDILLFILRARADGTTIRCIRSPEHDELSMFEVDTISQHEVQSQK